MISNINFIVFWKI